MTNSAYDYRLRTPSPRGKRKSWGSSGSPPTFSDRLIPSRAATNLACGFDLVDTVENANPCNTAYTDNDPACLENGAMGLYDHMLQSELLGKMSPFPKDESSLSSPERSNLLQYKSTLQEVPLCFGTPELPRSPVPLRITEHPGAPMKAHRKIQKSALRVMDAPGMQDDYYFNLLDWSVDDDLAVGLSECVYTWNNASNKVVRVADLDCSLVTSVSWAPSGLHLGVGTCSGDVQIWDKAKCRKIRTMTGHEGNVCSIAWNGHVLSTGGQDGCILHRDVREPAHFFEQVRAHRQQVCGLKWSPDQQHLASGSDDCKVRIWNMRSSSTPMLQSDRHTAAVKALAWSPHQVGVLATGGGVADKCIHTWNTVNDVTMRSVDTGSQVCNLVGPRMLMRL